MIIAGTGHRPPKLGGYDPYTNKKVLDFAQQVLKHFKPTLVISGMAQGWDMSLAQAAVNLKIPFHAYIPFIGQEQVWPSATRHYYHALLLRAETIIVCSPNGYSGAAMQARNIQMVNACDLLVALWDGSPGGTANCVNYAQFMQRPIVNVWNSFIGESYGNQTPLPPNPVQENAGNNGQPAAFAGADWLG